MCKALPEKGVGAGVGFWFWNGMVLLLSEKHLRNIDKKTWQHYNEGMTRKLGNVDWGLFRGQRRNFGEKQGGK